MNKNNKSPWKSGYGAILGLFGLIGFFVAIGSLIISLNNPTNQAAIIFLSLGLALFGLCAIFGVINWVVEKQVNHNLIWLEYIKPFKIDTIDLGSDYSDPLVSLQFGETYVSKNFDQVFTADLAPVALGVSFYIFRNPEDYKKNFCVIYSQYGLSNQRFKAFARVS